MHSFFQNEPKSQLEYPLFGPVEDQSCFPLPMAQWSMAHGPWPADSHAERAGGWTWLGGDSARPRPRPRPRAVWHCGTGKADISSRWVQNFHFRTVPDFVMITRPNINDLPRLLSVLETCFVEIKFTPTYSNK